MQKKSITLFGHATSILLEDEFWEALTRIAKDKKISRQALISEIDKTRQEQNLASALRVFVLKTLINNTLK